MLSQQVVLQMCKLQPFVVQSHKIQVYQIELTLKCKSLRPSTTKDRWQVSGSSNTMNYILIWCHSLFPYWLSQNFNLNITSLQETDLILTHLTLLLILTVHMEILLPTRLSTATPLNHLRPLAEPHHRTPLMFHPILMVKNQNTN